MSRDGDHRKYGAAAITALLSFVIITGVIPAMAGWSTDNNTINYWVHPDTDNLTIYYAGTTYSVSAITYGYDTAQYFELRVKNDNYASDVDLRWVINSVVYGPVPSASWHDAGWAAFANWDNVLNKWTSAGVGPGGSYADFTLSPGENHLARISFIFQDETDYSVRYWFPGQVTVQLKLYNRDNDETYWTPVLNWWVWRDPLENVVMSTVADTYTQSPNTSTNYGTENYFYAWNAAGANDQRRGYAKFPLSVPPNWGIQRAWVKYFVEAYSTQGGAFFSYRTGTAWLENTLTWGNQDTDAPVIGESLGDFDKNIGVWNYKDVSSSVREAMLAGESYYSFHWKSGEGGSSGYGQYLTIRSKEYGDGSYASQLIIELAPLVGGVNPVVDVLYPVFGEPMLNKYAYTTLRGEVENMGDETTVTPYFQLSTTPDFKEFTEYGGMDPLHSRGTFSRGIGYLVIGDTYYVRVRAVCSYLATWVWSDIMTFKVGFPPPPPSPPPDFAEITTLHADSIGVNKARLGYNLDIGGESYVDIYFHLTENADNLDNHTTLGVHRRTGSATGALLIEGLENDTVYYFRAYGIAASGDKLYGSWLSFRTLEEEPPPEEPPTFPSIRDWGREVGKKFGIGAEAGGIFCTIMFVLPVMLVGMLLTQGSNNQVMILLALAVMLMAVTLAFGWTPVWIPLAVILLIIFGIAWGGMGR